MPDNNQNMEYSEQEVKNLLGSADKLRREGDILQAIAVCRRIRSRNPEHADTLHYLGLLEFHAGNTVDAVEHINKAIQNNPGVASYHSNLGNILYRMRQYDDAKYAFRKAAELNQHDLLTLSSYAWLLADEGHTQEAAQRYREILEQQKIPGLQVRLALLAPAIYMSSKEILNTRKQFQENIQILIKDNVQLQDPFGEVGSTNFFLAYHGFNNRELQTLVAKFYVNACPELLYTAEHCKKKARRNSERIRIGFVSKFFGDHSIGRTTQGLIAKLNREKFEVVVFFADSPEGVIGEAIKADADLYDVLPGALDQARQRISEYELDIILYPDIGMDSFTYFLSFARLAPVQCTSFGHPDTTGVPNIDYFISTDCYETENSEQHYSENLVRLKGVASLAYYLKPAVPENYKLRESFGLDECDNIYICPQQLFKFHPDFDEILAGILRSDESGKLILIEGQYRYWDQLLMKRFQAVIPDVCSRIQFIPRQSPLDFINLIAISDVMLDTIHFCGQNTTHDGLAAGTPVVTMPGELQRSRHTMCFLKRAGLEHCIAKTPADYVRIAVELATNPELQKETRLIIKKNAHRVWSEQEVILEHERFFQRVAGALVSDL